MERDRVCETANMSRDDRDGAKLPHRTGIEQDDAINQTPSDIRDRYLKKGLPPAPISNPGLDAIKAALNPDKNKYWFYLADSKGVTHYAIDQDRHVANKLKYLQ